MKVGTDGVILGAWSRLSGEEKSILDIGTGTGLLALMAAQRAPEAVIDAVEIDIPSARQAEANFAASPWGGRLRMHAMPIQQFAAAGSMRYGHIISNPPYIYSERSFFALYGLSTVH